MKSYYERKPGLIFLYLSDLLPSSEADNHNTNKKTRSAVEDQITLSGASDGFVRESVSSFLITLTL